MKHFPNRDNMEILNSLFFTFMIIYYIYTMKFNFSVYFFFKYKYKVKYLHSTNLYISIHKNSFWNLKKYEESYLIV